MLLVIFFSVFFYMRSIGSLFILQWNDISIHAVLPIVILVRLLIVIQKKKTNTKHNQPSTEPQRFSTYSSRHNGKYNNNNKYKRKLNDVVCLHAIGHSNSLVYECVCLVLCLFEFISFPLFRWYEPMHSVAW